MHDNHETQKINQTSVMPEKTGVYWNSQFSVAPMLDWTDRHCRYFLRLLSRNTLLYTEMVTTGAIIHGKGDYLAYSEEEHPVA
ncbi:tRNA-dihydrouridine synthase, partial [Shigella flexneri]